ncbi:MAG: 6-phosphogluconolactonase [Thiohalophilus sp.]
MKSQYHYQIYLEPGQLAQAAARRWVKVAQESIRARNSFHVSLAGGSTPKPVYQLLQQEELEWDKIHLYWGDERDVPTDHPESNYLMVKEALIDHVPIPDDNVHPIRVQADIEKSVEEYRRVLDNVYRSPDGLPCFDLVMLGMGDDGHIASLFPDSSALTVTNTPVVSVYVEKLDSWRVTLTYPVLNAARNLMLLVTGEAKAPIVAQALGGNGDDKYPVQKLAPQGRAEWYLDQAAASQLSEST